MLLSENTISNQDPRFDYLLTYSDYHKDAYGYRPRYNYQDYTLEQLKADYERFGAICEENRKAEEIRHQACVKSFEALINKTIGIGANDRVTALRWIIDGANDSDLGYILYTHGISQYTDYGRKITEEIEANCLDILNRNF